MPELPEVESTCRFLDERIRGECIAQTEVYWPRTVGGNAEAFCQAVTGLAISEVFRRAKLVCFRLEAIPPRKKQNLSSSGKYLSIHMRMSGSFDVIKSAYKAEKHDRLILRLKNGASVVFTDPRKFGRAVISDDFDQLSRKYGIEPLSEAFSVDALSERLQRARSLKPLLLDQSVVAGLGNIYVDEVLWHTKLHPLRTASTLKQPEIIKLHKAIQSVLHDAIANLGTDFGDGVFEMGGYQPVVYGRDQQPCTRCGTHIQRLVVGQRGTHICPRCQIAPS